MPAGPIATEVIREVIPGVVKGLSSDGPLAVEAVKPIPTYPVAPPAGEPAQPPLPVRDKAVPVFGSAAWWFQKGGPVGVLCFLLIGTVVWMGNAQRSSNNALIQSMQDQQKAANEERRELTKMLMQTQAEISSNMARMARSIERMEAKFDKKD